MQYTTTRDSFSHHSSMKRRMNNNLTTVGGITTRMIGLLVTISLVLLLLSIHDGDGNNGFVRGSSSELPLLLGSGSSLVEEVHKEIANYFIGYMKRTVDVMYDADGSGQGITRLFNHSDQYSYAATDYGLKPANMKEKSDATVLPFMATYITIICNVEGVSNSINFTREALVGIFNGTISVWNDKSIQELNPFFKFPNDSINVVVRNDSSGTTDMLSTAFSSFSKEWASTFGKSTSISWSSLLSNRIIHANDAKDVSFIITSTKNSIGYTTPTTFEQHLPANIVTRSGTIITPSTSYLKNVLSTTPPNFDSNFMYRSSVIEDPDIYPFIGLSYLVYYSTTMSNCEKARYLAKLLEFYISDRGVKVIEEAGFASLTADATFKDKYMAKLKNFTCNGQPLISSSNAIVQNNIVWIVLIIQMVVVATLVCNF